MEIIEKEFTLRNFDFKDFHDIHSYSKDIENLKYTLWGPNKEEDTYGFIKYAIEKSKENPRRIYELVVEIKNDDSYKVIGACSIVLNEGFTIGEVGWILNKHYWNKGYGTKIGRALLKFGFEELNLKKIFATCDSRNIGSYRIMEKCNMKKENIRPKVRKGKSILLQDEFRYSISKEEYFENKY